LSFDRGFGGESAIALGHVAPSFGYQGYTKNLSADLALAERK
jgi:hypothetical protein